MNDRQTSVKLRDETESAEQVRQRFEVNGWTFVEILKTSEDGPIMFFRKPGESPDVQPFAESNIKV